ncbi:hypothetical protein MMC12_001441 [Toensbergia leucococca]|nr:hypothetical protein [Toensbergia leucococca]
MDEASADLVLSLQLEDLDRLLGASAEQQATLKQPDSRVALTTYHDELDKRRRNIRDGRMGRSIAQANHRIDAAERGQTAVPALYPPDVIDLTDDVDEIFMQRLAAVNVGRPGLIDLTPRPRLTLGQQLRRKRSVEGNTFKSVPADESSMHLVDMITAKFVSSGFLLWQFATNHSFHHVAAASQCPWQPPTSSSLQSSSEFFKRNLLNSQHQIGPTVHGRPVLYLSHPRTSMVISESALAADSGHAPYAKGDRMRAKTVLKILL